VRHLTELRESLPVLRPGRFSTGEMHPASETRDVAWLDPAGAELRPEQWEDPELRCFAMLADGRAQHTVVPHPGSDLVVLLIVNASHEASQWTLPRLSACGPWVRLVDTALPAGDAFPAFAAGRRYTVGGRSLTLFSAAPGRDAADFLDGLVARLAMHGVHAVPAEVSSEPADDEQPH